MLKHTLIILLFFVLSLSSAQSGETQQNSRIEKPKIEVLFSPGIIVQHETFLDLNLLIGVVVVEQSKIPVIGVTGIRVGVETNLRDGHNHTIAPKIGFEMSATIFSMRLSAVNYFQNGNSEFRMLPELGISVYGWANLTYGYGIPFNNGNLNNVSCHRVSLSFNLDKRLSNAVFEY